VNHRHFLLAMSVAGASLIAPHATRAQAANLTLTAVPGVKVGHYTLSERPTGCTAVLVEGGATAGVDVRGAAPASAETDLLKPVNLVQQVFAISLSGGSAFGLDARSGIMRYLDEKNIGFKAYGSINVPIVPAASLIDLNVGTNPKIRPTADCGYRAAQAASTAAVPEGNVGAGAGATVGKSAGASRAMKAGIGSAAIRMPDGLIVAALVAVNAAGDVIDPATGKVVAGVRTENGKALADARVLLTSGAVKQPARLGENTTLGVVATNATLTKTQATKIAEMAHDGFARAIYPSHTMGDGDIIFALATGTQSGSVDVSRVGALAAQVVADAIVRAARQATSIPGYPAARDLR
jgi:L-aminopeptidase/D-esterase-like protein